MNSVRRTKGIIRFIRIHIFGRNVQRFVTAGDRPCGRMMQEARFRRQPGPSDQAILAWAKFDLAREILGGFWEIRTA
ncbi:MAG: hypothetical protein IKQ45_02565 [Clostridia bacterium]|nr:hypothetical protein [Clostridia bacterium]